MRSLVALSVGIALCVAALPADAVVLRQLVRPVGFDQCWAVGVSSNGIAVGSCSASWGSQGFRWTPDGEPHDLGSYGSYADDISGDGAVVVGDAWSATSYGQPFRWTEDAGLLLLGDLPGGDLRGGALGVSADGSVIVGTSNGASGFEAFRWTASTGMVGLGDLAGGFFDSVAEDVSDDGSCVVGYSSSTPDGWEAFRWTDADGMVGLGTLPGDEQSFAEGVSADGLVVVGSSFANGAEGASTLYTPFRWTPDLGMVDLGQLAGATSGSAFDVSADGTIVVGYSGDQAFVWDAGHGMRALATVLEGDYGLDLGGWSLPVAWGVAPSGRAIAGAGSAPSDEPWQQSGWVVHLDLEPRCHDGVDNDGDGLVDFPADPGCASALSDTESPPCSDGIDNDGDGFVDYPDDVVCTSASGSSEAECGNGIDDDGDGRVDLDDPGCDARTDPSEVGECQNGIDDDGDGFTDVDDPGCIDAADASEYSDWAECDNGIDDDGDGLVDLADPGCPFLASTPENPPCDDGIDNDGDGLVDFADPQCSPGWPYWEKAPRPSCGLGGELVLVLGALARRRRRTRA